MKDAGLLSVLVSVDGMHQPGCVDISDDNLAGAHNLHNPQARPIAGDRARADHQHVFADKVERTVPYAWRCRGREDRGYLIGNIVGYRHDIVLGVERGTHRTLAGTVDADSGVLRHKCPLPARRWLNDRRCVPHPRNALAILVFT